ncbi:relaxase family protein [Acinetobacter terrae]|uniref:Relaxase/mobilization nuclease domain-containing protein n=1 Tax=Acinetobacter terrae TaxID=2731247 RepID=A0A8E4H599_9GAMM|nr:relaxase/mobilization nuclease domain-containing protein [Acinetobacter terrae]NNH37986.1 relaxase/mobilization nuclease domain-containing protein [Acinetobacter terrae]
MIVDFFRRGTGAAKGPIDYLLGKDRDREHAKLLAGDLQEVTDLIDSSGYTKKYTAGCLSFYEHDLKEEDKQKIMADFEKTLFPGLSSDNYRILWVKHQDKVNAETGKTRLELNFLIPNIEIQTGKRLQPFFAKEDLFRVDCFKKMVNFEYGLFDPDDPINRRAIKVAKNLPKDKKEFIEALGEEVKLAISENLLSDRESLISWFDEIGLEITRITKRAISVKHPNYPERMPIPLKGELYEQNFRNTDEGEDLKREASAEYRKRAEERYNSSCERYNKFCEEKRQFHIERYGSRNRHGEAEPERRDKQQEKQPTDGNQLTGNDLEQGKPEVGARPTSADQNNAGQLAAIKRIEPSYRTASSDQENPFFIHYSTSLDSTYFAYQQYLFRLRQQREAKRNKRAKGATSEIRYSYPGSNAEIQRYEPQNLPTWGQINDVRSQLIENHRRTTAAIEATTERAKRELASTRSLWRLDREIREADSHLRREAHPSREDSHLLSRDHPETTRANTLRAFFRGFTEQLKSVFREAFDQVGQFFTDQRSGQARDPDPVAEPPRSGGRERDQKADPFVSTRPAAETIKLAELDTAVIGKALSQVKENMLNDKNVNHIKVQEKKNDNRYDHSLF